MQAATINVGSGGVPGSAGVLAFAGTGLTGTINVNGGTIRALTAGAFGTGTINMIDPTAQYAASGTYANPIVLQSTNPATDPTTLQTYGSGIVATLTGPITEVSAGQPLVFSSINTDGSQGTGTFVLTNPVNNWTGTTAVAAGTTLRGTTATLSGASFIANGVLDFDQATTDSSARAITGSGVVQVTGGGSVALTGAITALGGVQVGAGTTATLSNVGGSTTSAVSLIGAGATLNVASGGSVSSINGNAVYSNVANNSVVNAGTLAGNATYTGVYLQSAAAGTNTVTNTATGIIRGYDGVYSRAALTLTNAGTITALTNNGITALDAATITNQAGGVINATAIDGFGIDAEGATLAAVNAGTINADDGVVKYRGTGTLTNTGAVNGGLNGVLTAGNATFALVNSGTITGSRGFGVSYDGAGSVTNSGTITGTDIGVASYRGGLTLTSTGTIGTTAGTYAIQSNGAFADNVTLGASSVTNGAVSLGAGDDTLTLTAGASLSSFVDGGDGNDTLVLDGSGAGTFASGRIGGFETGVKQGTGSWTLTGTVAASPTSWAVNAGTLTVAGGNAIANNAAVNVAAGATLNLQAGETIDALSGAGGVTLGANTLTVGGGNGGGTFAGVIAGSGGLTKVNTGIQTLSGANTYTGATTIAAGTLALGASNVIADASAVNVASGATFDLAGYNDTVATLTGNGAVMLGAGTLTTGNATDYGFGGTVSGTGDLTKVGAGTMTLTGANPLAGRLNANAGTLMLLGSVAGSARVQGGTLAGTGRVAGNLLVSSGTLSVGTPTQAIGTVSTGSLTVTGGTTIFDFAGSSGGFLADRLNVTGAALLQGGLVQARATEATANYLVSQTYTLIQAGSVTGTFANGATFTAASNSTDLYWRLRYDLVPNAVVLEVRKQLDFNAGLSAAGGSTNQIAVGAALTATSLTASDAFASTLNAIAALDTAGRLATYNSISGEGIADLSTSVALMNQRFTQLLSRRLATGAGACGNAGLLASLADGSRGLANARVAGALADASPAGCQAGARGGAWVQSFGGYGLLRGQAGSANLFDQSYGIAAGVDGRFGPVTVGVAGSGAGVDSRIAARASKGNGTIYQGAGYAAYDDGTLYANAIGSYFSGDVTSRRSVFVGSTEFGVARGRARTHGYGGSATAGYRIDLGGGTRFTPQLSFEATHIKRDALTETGAGTLNLAASAQRRTLYQATAESRISHAFALGSSGGTVEPYVGGGFEANWGDRAALNTMRITGAPAGLGVFTVTGANLAKYTGVISGGIDGHPSDRVTLGVGLQAHRSPRQKDGAVQVHARIAF